MDFFPTIQPFKEVVINKKVIILDKDYTIFGKTCKSGSVLYIIGWIEICEQSFIIVNKGSWESLIDLSQINHLIKIKK